MRLTCRYIFLIFMGGLLSMLPVSARLHEGFITTLEEASGTGDVVGNGRIVIDDYEWNSNDPDIYLEGIRMERRNNRFEYFLNNLDIDPFASGTGDVVGNGGGYLESYAYFYYQNLSRHISTALTDSLFEFSAIERKILSRILYYLPQMSEDKLRFVRGEKAKALFFEEGVDASPRLAKTGFATNYPIYLNTDEIYKRFETSPSFLLSLIVHELGHQVGVLDHGLLDSIGAKVLQVSQFNTEQIRTNLERGDLLLTVYNHYHQSAPSDIFFSYMGKTIGVLKWDNIRLRQVCGREYVYSAVVTNLHWSQRITDLVSSAALNARAWLDVECFNSMTGMTRVRNRYLEIRIDINVDEIKTNMFITR